MTTIYVAKEGNDNGDGSQANPFLTITKAVSIANANDTIDTISIASGTYNEKNITITNNNLTITSANHSNTIINGTNKGTIFNIGFKVMATFKNLTLTNGDSSAGGAISNRAGANLTVKNCTFTGNTADEGGAIWNNGEMTVTGSTFTDNTATKAGGGAIFNKGIILTVIGSNFHDNTATNGSGGAIGSISGRTFNVTDSTFTNNFAYNYGGAIYNEGNSNIKVSTFTGNKATYGGAICNQTDFKATVNFNRIVGNIATTGSAIYNSTGTVNATLNWWGSINPDFSSLISGEVNTDPWIVLTISENPYKAPGNPTFTADLLHINTPGAAELNPANGIVPYTGPANFKDISDSGLGIEDKNFSNGSATGTLIIGLGDMGELFGGTVTATVDNQKVSIPWSGYDGRPGKDPN
jgi:predicted outer membrane repeat protein